MNHQPFFVPSLIIAIAAIPLVFGLIPKNRAYGIRTAKTLSDDRIWYPANRFGGWALIFSSLTYLVFAKACPTAGPHDPDFSRWLLHLGAFALPLVAGLALTIRYVRKL